MVATKRRSFRAGDRVVVRSPEEILATLDVNGTLDDVPFMPEMLGLCGQSFRVAKRVEKTCVEGHLMRRFPANDIVILGESRCRGGDHDGCNRACMIFWKEPWLREAGPRESAIAVDEGEAQRLRERLKAKADETHYFCQSTQLAAATEAFPSRYRVRMIWLALREAWIGNRSVVEVAKLLLHGVRLFFGKRGIESEIERLRGPNKRTPTEALGLQPGDRVRIKSHSEIVQTLDRETKNRGLKIAPAMTKNCGRQYEVFERVERMISETTGEMRKVRNTVSLRQLECLCYYVLGGCPRGDLQYWREIWLERSPDPSTSAPESVVSGVRDSS